jgi:hypothetical protein
MTIPICRAERGRWGHPPRTWHSKSCPGGPCECGLVVAPLPAPGPRRRLGKAHQDSQHGGVYARDSPESMRAFRAGELSRSICDVYQVTESPA